jgi:hypothetical protein
VNVRHSGQRARKRLTRQPSIRAFLASDADGRASEAGPA